MRKLVLIPVLLAFASCSQFSWQGQRGAELTEDQRSLGVRDVAALAAEYESTSYWAGVRRRSDGRRNAFGRGLANFGETFSRHFMNYSKHDPYVNYPSDVGYFQHTGRFLTSWVGDFLPRQ